MAARDTEPIRIARGTTVSNDLQQLLDNPFLLLFLGIAMPTVFYIVWGVMEMVAIPISPLAR